MASQHPKVQLSIVIVGCGLGGLAAALCLANAGHRVTILEADIKNEEVGAGLQVSPNISRLLWRWGFRQQLEKVAVSPTAATWRRYDTGTVVGSLSTREIERDNGVPFYNVHRGDLHRILLRAVEARVEIRTNAAVVLVRPGTGIDEASEIPEEGRPSIVLASGEELYADLVIGADGVKSVTRKCLFPEIKDSVSAISSAYRAVVPASKLLDDPLLKELVETPEVTCWMGPGSNVVGYCISAAKEYNLVFASSPSSTEEGFVADAWSVPGDIGQLRVEFSQWEPRVNRLMEFIPSALKWKLVDRPVLDYWVHSTGRVVLLGDACHATLPYGGQGAAMAIEDGAVLGNLLSRVTSHAQVPSLLLAYESLRKHRCTLTQAAARRNEKLFHMKDGPEQQARDKQLGQTLLSNGNATETAESRAWAEKMKNQDQFGYDADAVVERWRTESRQVEGDVAAV